MVETAAEPFALIAAREGQRRVYARAIARLGLQVRELRDRSQLNGLTGGAPPVVAILEVEDGGHELCRELHDLFGPRLPVVLISERHTDPSDVVAGLLAGADEYAAESMDDDEFIARVRRLIERSRLLDRGSLDLPRVARLTPREREVLELLTDGMSQKQIAVDLGISVKTAGAHVQNILGKLGIHSRAEAAAVARRAADAAHRRPG